MLLEAGNPVWVEQPGYGGARDVLRLRGAKLTAVPVDSEGLNVAAGIERCPRARAAYVTPSHQYPMGMTMSASRRLQLLDWAHRNGSWVVEDDYDSEYRYENLPIASLQGPCDLWVMSTAWQGSTSAGLLPACAASLGSVRRPTARSG